MACEPLKTERTRQPRLLDSRKLAAKDTAIYRLTRSSGSVTREGKLTFDGWSTLVGVDVDDKHYGLYGLEVA
jgi:hypothetical protein